MLPFEALYQAALSAITADTVGFTRLAIDLGPFGGAEAAGPLLWPWARRLPRAGRRRRGGGVRAARLVTAARRVARGHDRTGDGGPDGLQSGLKRRHVTMIALGGVIGAGLFVGSGAVINQTGPAAVLSYLLAGLLVVLVMRMLGEMAVANPSTGSFADYARMSLGNWAGLHRRLAVLVVLGDRARHRGGGGRRDPPALDRRPDLGLVSCR